jgi:hypothetical protein
MDYQKKHLLLNSLKERPEKYREILPDLFNLVDPDKRHHIEHIWLNAVPKSQVKNISLFTETVIKTMEPDPATLRELIVSDRIGTIFEVLETGESYQLAGFNNHTGNGVALPLGSKTIVELDMDIPIRRVF